MVNNYSYMGYLAKHVKYRYLNQNENKFARTFLTTKHNFNKFQITNLNEIIFL